MLSVTLDAVTGSAEIMRCPTYHCIMSSATCLLYQDYSRGKIKLGNSWNQRGGTLVELLKIKYKPCLTCETGKKVKSNGGQGMDRDVEKLKKCHVKSNNVTPVVTPDQAPRTCRKCGHIGPDVDFHHATGLATSVCKACVKKVRVSKAAKPINAILVDFESCPELLQMLKDDAVKNFRTVQNEILYRLVNYGKN